VEGHRRTLSRPSPDLSPARAFQERRWFTTHRRCYLPRWHSGMGRQAGSSRVCPAPGLTAPPARVDGSDLLIRRYLYRRPDPSRSVRDLGLISPGCPGGSGSSQGCSSVWLPAWLPAARPAGTTNGFQEGPRFAVRRFSYLGFRHDRLLRHPRSSRVYPARDNEWMIPCRVWLATLDGECVGVRGGLDGRHV
jgi:hypothetical protein